MTERILTFPGLSFRPESELEKVRQALEKAHRTISIKTPEEIEKLRVAGKISASILDEISPYIKPGMTKKILNEFINDLICNKNNAEIDRLAADGETNTAFRISACFGHNNIIINAEPDEVPLEIGDIFGIDISLKKDGWCGDTRRSWIVGDEASPSTLNLYTVSQNAMWLGIGMVREGAKLDDIANAVEHYASKRGCTMLKLPVTLGHSLGKIHMDGWLIPLYNDPMNNGRVLKKGMVITIETFMCAGTGEAGLLNNSLGTGATKDGSYACYWEHSVAVTEDGCDILDLRAGEHAEWAKNFSL